MLRILILSVVLLQIVDAGDLSRCTFPHKNYEEDSLKMLKHDNLGGLVFSTTGIDNNNNNNYTFTIGICADVNGNEDKEKCDAVTQTKPGDQTYVLGRCTHTDVHAGSDWVMLTYENGDRYHTCNGTNRKSIVMISCDCSVPGNGKLMFGEEFLNSTSECYYLFEINTRLICKDNCSSAVVPTCPPTNSPIEFHGMSGGSIFLIIFFTLLGTYLVFGFLINFCTGHYGIELIPNVHFWMNFFNLVADGCDYIFRCGPYAESRLRIEGEFGDTGYNPISHGSMSSSQRRGPLTPPPSALPPTTPALSETSSGYQNFNSLGKNQRPISTTGSLTGEVGSLASTSNDDTYLIQA